MPRAKKLFAIFVPVDSEYRRNDSYFGCNPLETHTTYQNSNGRYFSIDLQCLAFPFLLATEVAVLEGVRLSSNKFTISRKSFHSLPPFLALRSLLIGFALENHANILLYDSVKKILFTQYHEMKMKEFKIDADDIELIESAARIIRKGYKENWHGIGAALRSTDGEIFSSINIDANVGRVGVCAEPIALANAIMAGKKKFDTIVAVRHLGREKEGKDYEVVSPCGMCREMITDYDDETKVIASKDGKLLKVLVADLLPLKFE